MLAQEKRELNSPLMVRQVRDQMLSVYLGLEKSWKSFKREWSKVESVKAKDVIVMIDRNDSTVTLAQPKKKFEVQPCAAEEKQIKLMEVLVAKGASTDFGMTVSLVLAASYGHFSLMRELLLSGANPNGNLSILFEVKKPSTFRQYRKMRSRRLPFKRIRMAISDASDYLDSDNVNDHDQNPDLDEHHEEVQEERRPWNPWEEQDIPPELQGLFGGDSSLGFGFFHQAVSMNHLSLVALLLEFQPRVVAPRASMSTLLPRRSSLARESTLTRSSTLYRQLQNAPPITPLSESDLSSALTHCLVNNELDMAKLLMDGYVSLTTAMYTSLLHQVGIIRLFGLKKHSMEQPLLLALASLSREDFVEASSNTLKLASELGYLELVKYVLDQGGNVNTFEGMPLYLAVYNGHAHIVRELLSRPLMNLDLFNSHRWFVCAGLLCVELVAIGLFFALVGVWLYTGYESQWQTSIVYTNYDDNSQVVNYGGGDAFGQLTGIVLASGIAVTVMYVIVPLHKIAHCLILLVIAKHSRPINRLPV